MNFEGHQHSPEVLLHLYRLLLRPRLIEEKMFVLLRQGRISKWFSGLGQEAISVGATAAMNEDEYILTLHRNLGVFTTREVSLYRLFCQFIGKADGFTRGRDRSFHFGTLEHRIVGMISHLGAQLGVADGVALAQKLQGNQRATLVFTGDGGTSEGDFHEALNVASVWKLPVIFVIENNGYALSTPVSEQFNCEYLSDRAAGYGMEWERIDGNNVVEVYDTVFRWAGEVRENPRPVLIECMTFRMRGHEETSGTKYVPQTEFDHWGKRDPVVNFEKYLLEQGILTIESDREYRREYNQLIDESWDKAYGQDDIEGDPTRELEAVYASTKDIQEVKPSGETRDLRLIDAVSEGLYQGLEKWENSLVMGQDVAELGGVFKVTEGFLDTFGRDRIRNTPLCESAIVGAALGLAIEGYKSVVEMQFSDFVSCAFNQIVNNLAKVHYRWGQPADVVIRLPSGAGVGAGPFHSQSTEGWFFHTPGLKLVYPSNPRDAKGLLLAAMEDPNPVLYYEHKALYRKVTGPVPEEFYTVPIGRARLDREGEDLTIITYGQGVHWARAALDEAPEISADLLDLRTLLPWDREEVARSVKKTGKALVLYEDTYTGGVGAEIAAYISQHLFIYLDGPVVRCASMDTPIPMAGALERDFLPPSRLGRDLRDLWEF